MGFLKITNFRGVNRIMTEIFPNIFSVIGQGEMDDLKSIAELKSLEKLEKSLSKLKEFETCQENVKNLKERVAMLEMKLDDQKEQWNVSHQRSEICDSEKIGYEVSTTSNYRLKRLWQMLSLKNKEILYLRNLVDEAECFNLVDFKDL